MNRTIHSLRRAEKKERKAKKVRLGAGPGRFADMVKAFRNKRLILPIAFLPLIVTCAVMINVLSSHKANSDAAVNGDFAASGSASADPKSDTLSVDTLSLLDVSAVGTNSFLTEPPVSVPADTTVPAPSAVPAVSRPSQPNTTAGKPKVSPPPAATLPAKPPGPPPTTPPPPPPPPPGDTVTSVHRTRANMTGYGYSTSSTGSLTADYNHIQPAGAKDYYRWDGKYESNGLRNGNYTVYLAYGMDDNRDGNVDRYQWASFCTFSPSNGKSSCNAILTIPAGAISTTACVYDAGSAAQQAGVFQWVY